MIFVVIACFLPLMGTIVYAEPTPSVRWLMNEPASLFDIGIMRMREANLTKWFPELMSKIEKRGLKSNQMGPGVVYDWNNNIIDISASFVGPLDEPLCSEVLAEYKQIIAPLRKSSPDHSITLLGSYFDHLNYSAKNLPKDLEKNIVQIMVFTVGISGTPSLGGRTIFCRSKLFDDTPSFTRYDLSR